MNQRKSWKESVIGVLIEIGKTALNSKLTIKQLRQFVPKMVVETQSVGKTPEQTLARELQTIRDMGILQFVKKSPGNYVLIKHPDDVTKHAKNAKRGSVGERMLASMLDKLNIKYMEQFADIRIRNVNPLPFDFMAMVGNTQVLIEYDGVDHNKMIPRSKCEIQNWQRFLMRKRLDKIKNNGAAEHGYELCRINCDDVTIKGKIDHALLKAKLDMIIKEYG